MSSSDGDSKDDLHDSIIGFDEKINRSEFLKKLVAGGIISAVALSGLGKLNAFGAENSSPNSGIDAKGGIPAVIQQINSLRTQLDELQGQFENVISGKSVVPEMVVQKLTTSDGAFGKLTIPDQGFMKISGESTFYKLTIPDTGFMKITGESTFYKLTIPENGFLKMDGDSAFVKLTIPENGFLKMDGDSAFLKLTIPENGFLKIEGDSAFLKLTVPEKGFMKIDGDATFSKIDAAEITAQKIVAQSITTEDSTIG